MKIVIAPDSFKESLSAAQVAECIERGFRQVFPDAEYCKLPLADGGEGTIDALLHGLPGERHYCHVSDPLGRTTMACWAALDEGRTGLLEFAQASGLDKLTVGERNPAFTSSFGTGQLIAQALDSGVDKLIIGLGGSAINDGGAGIVQALGGQLLNRQGQSLALGGIALHQLACIDLTQLHPRCADVELLIACDVDNPLCGPQGASHVFGRQKGATAEQRQELDHALGHFADIAAPHTGVNHRDTPGFGAAGGTPLGLSLLFDSTLRPGIDIILDALDADALLEGCDLLITGEGKMDNQTLQGKTPYGIAKRAKQKGIPVIGICGALGSQLDQLYSEMACVFGSVRAPQSLPQVLEEATDNLMRSARNVAAALKLGKQL